MSLIVTIATNWRKDRTYRKYFADSVDEHIGKVREDPGRWGLLGAEFVLFFMNSGDTVTALAYGDYATALIAGIFAAVALTLIDMILKFPLMMRNAHEYAISQSHP